MKYYLNNGLIYRDKNLKEIVCSNDIYNDLSQSKISIYDVNDIELEFRFSQISLSTKIYFEKCINKIKVLAKCIKRNIEYNVECINDKFIDYCIINNTWYYLNGAIEIYKELVMELNINSETLLSYKDFMNFNRKVTDDKIEFETNIIDSLKKDSLILKDDNLKANLYEYQKSGFNWLSFMVDNECGCILADEMGLGKTLQIISTVGFDKYRNSNSYKYLIVAPVSLLENWKREFAKFYPILKVYVNHGTNQKYSYKELLDYDVIVTSYTNIQTNLSMYNMIKWRLLILDEAQNIKNPYAKRTKAIKMVNRINSIAVTGTPFENHMTDLWSIIDFVIPNYLGSIGSFEKCFEDDENSAMKIEKYLSPIMIRRKVKDVAQDLPERIDIPQPILMTDEEAKFYEDGRNSIGQVEDLKQTRIQVIQGLRMFCTHPMVYDKKYNFSDPSSVSNKYSRMCEIIDNIIDRDEKVIIFTSFNEMINILVNDLKLRYDVYVNYVNGSIEPTERQKIIDEFSLISGSAILVLNPKAAGAGLNITAANHVIHYNLEWNPAVEDQASARAYRRGQDKRVFVYRLFYANTIEEIINERIERKRELSELAVIGNDGTIDNNDFIKVLTMTPLNGGNNGI